ncbi:MAG: hypothetical protein ACMX3H_00030, partial [Sodalis sp. (in: enterobacteria)]|uniref:hypothetical protein n=1 Tax=Sodalis sp. (in: enterobacteria) TaxID=1898979 RepID=UPI0039E26AFD
KTPLKRQCLSRYSDNAYALSQVCLLRLRDSHTEFALQHVFQIFSLFRIVKERYFAARLKIQTRSEINQQQKNHLVAT